MMETIKAAVIAYFVVNFLLTMHACLSDRKMLKQERLRLPNKTTTIIAFIFCLFVMLPLKLFADSPSKRRHQ